MSSIIASNFPSHAFVLKMDTVRAECSPDKETNRLDVEECQQQDSYSDAPLEVNAQADIHRISSAQEHNLFCSSYTDGKQYQKLRQYEKALQNYKVALQCKYRIIESEPTDIQEAFCNILFDIGEMHLESGHDSKVKGMESLHFCLNLRRTCFGSNHRSVAIVLTKLASVHAYFLESQYALDLLLEALAIFLIDSSPEESEENKSALIEVWNAMGRAHQALGHDEDAQSSFTEALKLK
jgi:tetratricopeptide (TPR) repeat protein